MKPNFLLLLFVAFSLGSRAQVITTIAGNGSFGYLGDGVPATTTALNRPVGVAIDAVGNVYFADRNNHRIRKVNTSGIISTIAGSGVADFAGDGGPATDASLNLPYGVAVDASGNIFFADLFNGRIRKIDTAGIIRTVAGNGPAVYNGDNIAATAASLNEPSGVAVDKSGNLFIVDAGNSRVRKVSSSGIITTIAGNGGSSNSGDGWPATAAELLTPYAIALDKRGNIYITEDQGNCVRKIGTDGIITRFAGTGTAGFGGDGGPAIAAGLEQCLGVVADTFGNVFISDAYNNRIRMVDTQGIISTIAGTGTGSYGGDNGPAKAANLSSPTGLALDKNGDLFIADFFNYRVRRVAAGFLAVKQNGKAGSVCSVYPNPTAGAFTLNVTGSSQEAFQVAVYNSLGEKVKELKVHGNSKTDVVLHGPAGLYYLAVGGDTNDYRVTIVLK